MMNPPFTKPTNHKARHADIPVPSIAGFNTSREEQHTMQRKPKRTASVFSSGHAGPTSKFMDLAHCKLKAGGVLAAVIPFAVDRGRSWKRAREALKAQYGDVHVTSIAATASKERAVSADTDLAECLVVTTRRTGGGRLATFSNLEARPSSFLEVAVGAKVARGRSVQGDMLNAGLTGVRSASVIEAARGLEAGHLRLPRQSRAVSIPVVPLGAVGARGLVHKDINGGPTDRNKTGPPQGPFVARSIRPGEIPTYPML